jgi:hypothetical protein
MPPRTLVSLSFPAVLLAALSISSIACTAQVAADESVADEQLTAGDEPSSEDVDGQNRRRPPAKPSPAPSKPAGKCTTTNSNCVCSLRQRWCDRAMSCPGEGVISRWRGPVGSC